MKTRILLLVLVFTIILTGCEPGEKDSGKLQVLTTIGMIGDVAKNIGGDVIDVVSLMGPGVDPHLYKASAGDVQRLSDAELILYNGLHLESKMGEIIEQMGSRKTTIAVTRNILESSLISDENNDKAFDPHVWFDVRLWKIAALEIKQALVSADPDNKEVFEKNYKEYSTKLDELHEYVRIRAAEVKKEQRVLITAHDAFGYFGEAYGFEVRGLQGISTAAEAGAGDVKGLADYIADNKIKALFIESSVPRRNVEALQAAVKDRGFSVEIGGELFSDAMGDPGTLKGTYLGMVRHNIDTIVEALK